MGVMITAHPLERDRDVEQIAEPFGRQHGLLGSIGGDPAVSNENLALDLRHDLFDVMCSPSRIVSVRP